MSIWMTNLHGIKGTAGLAQAISMDIGRKIGIKEIALYCNHYNDSDEVLNARLDGICSGIEGNDVVILQLPSWSGTRYEKRLTERIKYRMPSAHIVIFIHDIEPFMFGNWDDLDQWMPIYNQAEAMIVPTHFMAEYLRGHDCKCPKYVCHYAWDNPSELNELKDSIMQMNRLVQFLSDPSKFKILNSWSSKEVRLHYYSKDKFDNFNLIRHNPMPNQDLILQMHDLGGYGIMWEPPEKLLYWSMNTSMKFGAYMSAGLPVILHKGIAQQELVEKYHLGKAVGSIAEAIDFVKNTDADEYVEMAKNVNKIGNLTRSGYFIRQALIKVVDEALKR